MRSRLFLIVGLSILISTILFAQLNQTKLVKHTGKSFLADGKFSGGTLSKEKFDSLIAFPLLAADSNNKFHPVISYYLTYVERNVYEDDAGHPIILPDYYGINSSNGQLSSEWLQIIRDKSKGGDTVLITNITSFYNDKEKTKFYTKPIEIILSD